MIDPTAVSTVRVGELSPEPFSLTDNVPHEVGTELKRGTIEDLATFISAFIGSTDGVGFRAISVTDGQTLPTTTQQEFILVGKGTYYNVVGGSTIICTEELNAIVSNGSYWFIGVEIPVNVELAGITQFIRDGFINTTPSEDAVYEALALKANVADSENTSNKQNSLAIDGTGAKYPTVDAVNAIDLQKVLDVNGFAELASGGGNVGIYYFNEEGEDTGVFNVNLTDSISSSNSSINIVKGSIDIESSNSLESSRIQITPSTFNLSKRSLVDGDFNTNVTLSTPVENTTLNFPAKTVAGTYTLATTDETVNLTGDQTIEGNKQFTDNLSVDFNILLLNTDGDGYGEIQNSLNRFTFINQFGNIQFLMQNSGFVTYKSPTISGTFSNANLTANRTFTLPDATGTIPIVSQTITNGVTDKSPSEDAVFDALNLKVNLSGNQRITGVTTLVGVAGTATSLDVKNGNANGSILIGADVNAITRTNGVRKLARFTTPSFSDITKNHQIFAADFDDTTSSRIYFGGTNGSTQLGCTEINFVTVTANGNTGGNTAMQVKSSGAVTINTTTDDGIVGNKLQVNGNITASAATLSNQVVIKSQLDALRPYKVYTALMTQSGTSAPVATVLENTLGGTVVWTRTSPGSYVGTLAGAFVVNKTAILYNASSSSFSSFVKLNTANNTIDWQNGADDRMLNNGTMIEIKVYN